MNWYGHTTMEYRCRYIDHESYSVDDKIDRLNQMIAEGWTVYTITAHETVDVVWLCRPVEGEATP